MTTFYTGDIADPPFIQHHEREGPFYCHSNYVHSQVCPKHVIKAAELYTILETMPRKNAVWAALRAFSAALATYFPDYRYPLFWQGLESLFGSDDDRGVSRRLRDRISYFLANDPKTQQEHRKPGMLDAFLSPKRDDFLEAWVQSKAFTPPPFPK